MDAPYVELSKYKTLCPGAPNTPHSIVEVSERRNGFQTFQHHRQTGSAADGNLSLSTVMSLNTLPLLNPRETLKPDKNSTLRTSRNGACVENTDAVCIFRDIIRCDRWANQTATP
jgi:hypothetical protein